jgi:hypothetical protein
VWLPYTHLERLQTMASVRILFGARTRADQSSSSRLQVVYPGCPQVANATLTARIHSALDFWFEANLYSTNWWYNDLAAPRTVSIIMLLFEFNATQAEVSQSFVILAR